MSVIGGCVVRLIVKSGFILAVLGSAGCVNQAGSSDPYRVFSVTEDQRVIAQSNSLPYVRNKRGVFQTIEPIDFQTKQFGRVQIASGFVSDGSSRPFDNNRASTFAALLHDALYRGATELRFLSGYKGEWTKEQADSAYCEQLEVLGAPANLARTNCLGVRLLRGNASVWGFHRSKREAYWAAQRTSQQTITAAE